MLDLIKEITKLRARSFVDPFPLAVTGELARHQLSKAAKRQSGLAVPQAQA